jgi:DNA-binding response OmpR family regulator
MLKKSKILVIESSFEIRENFAEMLELYQCDVLTSSDCISGLKEAIDFRPDVIICDSNGLNGCPYISSLSFIKSNPSTSHIPLIITSTNDTVHYKMKCLERGAESFLLKPFSMDVLIAGVYEIIASSRGYQIGAA